MIDLASVPALLLSLITLALTIGAIFVVKRGSLRQAAEIEARVISGLNIEIASLRRKIEDLETDRAQQDNVIRTIRLLLKDTGYKIIISGKTVTLQDRSGSKKTTSVQGSAPVTPIVPGDDDDAV
jgi:hypothetical protein